MAIAIAGARKQRQRKRHVIDPSREEADVIERRAEMMHADARDRAKTRLEADHAIEGGGPHHGAQRLAAQRQRNDAGSDGGRRA